MGQNSQLADALEVVVEYAERAHDRAAAAARRSRAKQAELRRQVAAACTEAASVRAELREAEVTKQQLEDRLAQSEQARTQLEAEIAGLQRQIATLEARPIADPVELEAARQRAKNLQAQLDRVEREKAELQEQIEELPSPEATPVVEALSDTEAGRQIIELQAKLVQARQERDRLRDERDAQARRRHEAEEAFTRVQRQCATEHQRAETLQVEVNQLRLQARQLEPTQESSLLTTP